MTLFNVSFLWSLKDWKEEGRDHKNEFSDSKNLVYHAKNFEIGLYNWEMSLISLISSLTSHVLQFISFPDHFYISLFKHLNLMLTADNFWVFHPKTFFMMIEIPIVHGSSISKNSSWENLLVCFKILEFKLFCYVEQLKPLLGKWGLHWVGKRFLVSDYIFDPTLIWAPVDKINFIWEIQSSIKRRVSCVTNSYNLIRFLIRSKIELIKLNFIFKVRKVFLIYEISNWVSNQDFWISTPE